MARSCRSKYRHQQLYLQRYFNYRNLIVMRLTDLCTVIFIKGVARSPVISDSRIEEIGIACRTGPAPAFVDFACFIFDIEIVLFTVLMEKERRVPFHVRIDNSDKFAGSICQIFDHFQWFRKFHWIPSEISILKICIEDIKILSRLIKKSTR